jgi:RHS repeat-associated protein
LVAEFNAISTLTLVRSYTWGLDLTGSLTDSGGVGALLQVRDDFKSRTWLPTYDGNGNVVSLLDAETGSTASIAAVFEYGPFGEPIRTQINDADAQDVPFRFSTKFTDVETGLVYYGLRYYSPALGRFINRDPIEERGGLNLYGFVGNDGVGNVDYLGMYLARICTSWLTWGPGSIPGSMALSVVKNCVTYDDSNGGSHASDGGNTSTSDDDPSSENQTNDDIFYLDPLTIKGKKPVFTLVDPRSVMFRIPGINDRDWLRAEKWKAYMNCIDAAIIKYGSSRTRASRAYRDLVSGIYGAADGYKWAGIAGIGVGVAQGTVATSAATIAATYGGAAVVAQFGLVAYDAIAAKVIISIGAGSVATYATAGTGPERRRDLFMGNLAGTVDTVTSNRGSAFSFGVTWSNGMADSVLAARENESYLRAALFNSSVAFDRVLDKIRADFQQASNDCASALNGT